MNTDTAIRRAQVYRFLADAFLYPTENWLEDTPALEVILHDLDTDGSRLRPPDFGLWTSDLRPPASNLQLPDLQAAHRRAFGLVGSLCYETELGLPHEYRQSQEMADIAGFYRAFGFNVGGKVRERPDHISAELEFMHVLALKEAFAAESGIVEHIEVCADAQRKFLKEHLGKWVGLFAESLARSAEAGLYVSLARFAAAFVLADAERLGATVERRPLAGVKPTPLAPEMSCEACPLVE
jgi:DMSO reductase family type II enzyme chaperone